MLDAAEQLFAEHGFDGASLRAIAAAAASQQALLHYHFKTKDDLYRAVWVRWFAMPELSQDRLPALATESHDTPVDGVRHLVREFLSGPLLLSRTDRGRRFLAILGRELADPKESQRGLLRDFIDPAGEAFTDALRRVVPEMGLKEAAISYRLVAAATQAMFVNPSRTTWLTVEEVDERGEIALSPIVEFVTAGVLALLEPGLGVASAQKSSVAVSHVHAGAAS